MNLKDYKINYHYLSDCDMNCRFCFRFHSNVNKDKVLITFNELCSKTKAINLVGGEVYLDIPLLKKLILIGSSKNIQMSLVTNGYKLFKHLENPDVQEILSHLAHLGISVDSFNVSYNLTMGKCVSNDTLTFERLKKIVEVSKSYGCKVKINTVVTALNQNEILKEQIKMLQVDKWKVFKVVTNQNQLTITDETFREFINNNSLPILKYEDEEILQFTYLNVDSNGNFILNTRNKKPIVSIFDDISVIEQRLEKSAFSKEGYQSRYEEGVKND